MSLRCESSPEPRCRAVPAGLCVVRRETLSEEQQLRLLSQSRLHRRLGVPSEDSLVPEFYMTGMAKNDIAGLLVRLLGRPPGNTPERGV